MPEESAREEKDRFLCASCGKAIDADDLNLDHARLFDGKLFCPQCVGEQSEAYATTCKKCNHHDLPLFDGEQYLCRKCGAVVTVGKRQQAIASEKKCHQCGKALRPGAGICPACGARVNGASRTMNNAIGVKGFLVGAAATALLFVIGIAVWPQPAPEQPQAEHPQHAATDVKLEDLYRTIESSLKGHRHELMEDVAEILSEKEEALRALEARLQKLEGGAAPADVAEEDALDLDAIIRAMRDTKQPEEPDEPAAVPPVVVVPEEERPAAPPIRIPEVAEVPEVVEPQAGAAVEEPAPDAAAVEVPEPVDAAKEDIHAALAQLEAEANALAAVKEFVAALAVLDDRPDIRDPVFQANREKAKQTINARANELYRTDLARAEGMVRGGRVSDARGVYQEIIGYGLPAMKTEARKRLATLGADDTETQETAAQPSRQPRDAAVLTADDPRIPRYLAHLRDTEAAQHLRTQAARELGVLRAKAAVDDLVHALGDRDWYLRVCAASALGQLGDIKAVPSLIRNLEHPMVPVREAAKSALEQITGEDFGRSKDDWQEWWDEKGGQTLPAAERERLAQTQEDEEQVELAKQPDSFLSQVILFNEEKSSMTFAVEAALGLRIGQRLMILSEGEKFAAIELTVIGFGTATGVLVDPPQHRKLKQGDIIALERIRTEE